MSGVVEGSDAAADGQGHEALLDDAVDDIDHDAAALVAGGNVVEDQLVRPLLLVARGLLDGVAGVNVVEELDALDDSSAIDVEAGDDAFAEHKREG